MQYDRYFLLSTSTSNQCLCRLSILLLLLPDVQIILHEGPKQALWSAVVTKKNTWYSRYYRMQMYIPQTTHNAATALVYARSGWWENHDSHYISLYVQCRWRIRPRQHKVFQSRHYSCSSSSVTECRSHASISPSNTRQPDRDLFLCFFVKSWWRRWVRTAVVIVGVTWVCVRALFFC